MSDPSAQLETMKQQVLRMNAAQRKAFVRKLKENPALAQQANQFLGPVVLQFLYQDESQSVMISKNNMTNFRANNQPVRRGRGRGRPRLNPVIRGPDDARRNLYRVQLNKLLNISYPKPISEEINFIPRFDKDFCYLVGLDMVVQQMKEDENVFKKCEKDPYTCKECGTDFTTSWKAIGEDANDLQLCCEICFRQYRKNKVISYQTAVFKRAFSWNASEEMVRFYMKS